MSALDLCCVECRGWAAEEYEPRIAEMEDAKDAALSLLEAAESETDRLRTLFQKAKRAKVRAEAELAAVGSDLQDEVEYTITLRERAEQAEAELATMSARRCEGCEHADKNGDPWGCRANMLLFPKPAECCNRWTARAENGSEVTP